MIAGVNASPAKDKRYRIAAENAAFRSQPGKRMIRYVNYVEKRVWTSGLGCDRITLRCISVEIDLSGKESI